MEVSAEDHSEAPLVPCTHLIGGCVGLHAAQESCSHLLRIEPRYPVLGRSQRQLVCPGTSLKKATHSEIGYANRIIVVVLSASR